MEKIFFELIQVAIGTRQSLSRTPSADEWMELFAIAKKHALVGIAFAGVQKLSAGGDFGSSIGLPETLFLKWLGLTAKIQRRNQELNAECVTLCKQLAHDGFVSCVLKGQSNLVYYPEELRQARTAGDIDVLLRSFEHPDAIDIPVRYCLEQAAMRGKRTHVTYHHADLHWDGSHSTSSGQAGSLTVEVEAHYRATFLCSPLRNCMLQKWLEENMPFGVCDANCGECSRAGELVLSEVEVDPALEKTVENVFPIPAVSFNAIYQLLHIYKHMFEGGIGLRQLLDYYFVLRALHIEQGSLADRTQNMTQWAEGMGMSVRSNAEILHTLSSFGMKRFASAVMYVLQTVFAMPDEYLICQPNEKEGKFLLDEIMQAGNFGKYDDRIKHDGSQFSHAIEKTKHNLRLLTHYPEEVICEPFFRVYHWVWRRFELWRY